CYAHTSTRLPRVHIAPHTIHLPFTTLSRSARASGTPRHAHPIGGGPAPPGHRDPGRARDGFDRVNADRPRIHACANAASVPIRIDRKSTRLNSSHVKSAYAVFCLKKKNIHA